MKYIFVITMFALGLIACSGTLAFAQDSTKHTHKMKKAATKDPHHEMNPTPKRDASPVQEKSKGSAVETKKETTSTAQVTDIKVAASIKEIVGHYLALKNALVSDKTNEAATAGTALETAFKSFDKSNLSVAQKKAFEDVEDDAREHGEHIGTNAGNIEHQREHFDMLSTDMYDLVIALGGGQLLYKDYCPMYNDKKGAIWLSEKKEIRNPYFGKKMLSCGSVKEEIN